ncbi:MAG: GDP-mannose 4,6-dehydratase [Candidatus Omnitrophota bacterium]|jgi:UDP-glucose 4-epimerase
MYSKEKVLITGGAGFIGSHLVEELLQRGHEVSILDNLSTGRMENIAHLEKNEKFHVVIGDILNATLVDKLIERADWVFHLAAAVGVQLIVKDPIGVLTTNIKGSENVIETAYRYHRKILIASTSEIYGKNSKGPLKEEDDRILGSTTKSRWSYSTSKAVDEILAYTYWKEKKLPSIIVRLFNTVGPRQTGHYGMVVPRFVDQALKGKDITVYGDGNQTRCFLYVKDVTKAMIKLMEDPAAVGQVFNLGSQQEVSIRELAEKVIQMTGSSSRIVYIPYDQAYEEGFEDMQRRVPDTSKAAKAIGFKPTADLEKILQMVIEEFKSTARS